MKHSIQEHSIFARIARIIRNTSNMAITLGNTIHLSGVDKTTFLNHKKWVAHELCHVKQYKEHGFFKFILLYLRETVKNGYYNNKYEIDAREAEKDIV